MLEVKSPRGFLISGHTCKHLRSWHPILRAQVKSWRNGRSPILLRSTQEVRTKGKPLLKNWGQANTENHNLSVQKPKRRNHLWQPVLGAISQESPEFSLHFPHPFLLSWSLPLFSNSPFLPAGSGMRLGKKAKGIYILGTPTLFFLSLLPSVQTAPTWQSMKARK